MIYTLEQIKKFTPKERNDFIDEMIRCILKNGSGICFYLKLKTFDKNTQIEYIDYDLFEYLKIPILKPLNNNYWFTVQNQKDRISFLKSIKTAE